MERYYFKQSQNDALEDCPEMDMCIGSASCCLDCKNNISNDYNDIEGATWIICDKIMNKQK